MMSENTTCTAVAESPEAPSIVVPSDTDAPTRKRILYVNVWSSCHGGSSTSLLDIVTHLDRRHFDPYVICPENGELPDRLVELGIPVTIHTLSPLTKSTVFRFFREVLWYYRFLRQQKIAVVHANTGGWRRSIVAAAWLAKVPVVVHVRNPVKDLDGDFTLRIAKRIVANSNATAAKFLEDARYREKTETIYNAVDLSQYEETDDRRSEVPGMPRPIVGFVGHIVPEKGTITLLRAMHQVVQQFPNAILVMVGSTPKKYESHVAQCKKLIEELGLVDHVHFTGFRRDVPAWMRTFDVFVLPTQAETFGKVVVEAMAAGCPVIASAVGGVPEIISDPNIGTLVPVDAVDDTAAAITRHLANPADAKSIVQAASAHVREKFSMDALMTGLENLYSSLIEATGTKK